MRIWGLIFEVLVRHSWWTTKLKISDTPCHVFAFACWWHTQLRCRVCRSHFTRWCQFRSKDIPLKLNIRSTAGRGKGMEKGKEKGNHRMLPLTSPFWLEAIQSETADTAHQSWIKCTVSHTARNSSLVADIETQYDRPVGQTKEERVVWLTDLTSLLLVTSLFTVQHSHDSKSWRFKI